MTEPDVVRRARDIAEDLLFPRALQTDASEIVPKESLDALASAGLYGVVGPPEDGGFGADFRTFLQVIEILAAGCLSTAFVWIQHHGVVRGAVSSSTPGLRDRWSRSLCTGELRAGIALAGLTSGPARITVRKAEGGWTFSGTAPWVTGWGRIDVLQVAGRDAQDNVVSAIVDARPTIGLEVDPPLRMVALTSTSTSAAHFREFYARDDRIMSVQPLAERQQTDHFALQTHAAMALGLTARCIRLLGDTPLERELAALRVRLEAAAPHEVVGAKAAASELAHRAAATLVVATGSTSLIRTEHAQRLAREALFLLVFGSRPAIKAALLELLEARHTSARR